MAAVVLAAADGGVRRVRDVPGQMSDGDLTRSATVDSRDEIGEMASALERMRVSMRDTVAHIVDTSTTLASAAQHLTDVLTVDDVTDVYAYPKAEKMQCEPLQYWSEMEWKSIRSTLAEQRTQRIRP